MDGGAAVSSSVHTIPMTWTELFHGLLCNVLCPAPSNPSHLQTQARRHRVSVCVHRSSLQIESLSSLRRIPHRNVTYHLITLSDCIAGCAIHTHCDSFVLTAFVPFHAMTRLHDQVIGQFQRREPGPFPVFWTTCSTRVHMSERQARISYPRSGCQSVSCVAVLTGW